MSALPEPEAAAPTADSLPETAAPREGELIAGKYRVERLIGKGGMGVVVAARHVQLGQTVAIKLLSASAHALPDAAARFLREAQAAAALVSDHVVRIYDVGTLESGAPFMVMEHLRGEDLSSVIEHEAPMPAAAAVELVLQAAGAIGEAHDLGIVHRDLKPSNLFVTHRSDGSRHIKVLDFGISKSLRGAPGESQATNLTATRTVLGSPYYMAPEQVRDSKNVDGRVDVWALGVILYELVTGRPPFQGESVLAVCAAIAADEPVRPRLLVKDCPDSVEAIVLRCLDKDPARRYRTVHELCADLARYSVSEGRASLASGRVSSARSLSVPNDAETLPPPAPPDSAETLISAGNDSKRDPATETLREAAPPRRRSGYWVLAAGASCALLLGLLAPRFSAEPPAPAGAAPTEPPAMRPAPVAELDPPSPSAAATPSAPSQASTAPSSEEPSSSSAATPSTSTTAASPATPIAASAAPAPRRTPAPTRRAPVTAPRETARPPEPAPQETDIRLER